MDKLTAMRRVGTLGSPWFAMAAAAVVGVVSVLVGVSASTAASSGPVTLRATFASFPDYMDPQLSYTAEGWDAMYDTYVPLLTYRHASGRAGADVIPGLTRSMPKISDGGRTYTLFLRRGLKYSNGKPVKASDFKYTVKRMFKLNSGGSVFFGLIRGIGTDDKSGKIVIHLAHPSGTFEDVLATPFAALVPAGTPMHDLSFDPPPATGPYVITNSQPGTGWSYERNPVWRSTNKRRLPQLPSGHVDRIEVKVVRNPEAQVNGVLSGKFDWMQNPPPANWIGLLEEKYDGTQFRLEPTLSTYYFWMNMTRPPFDDIRVRRAVNYAIYPDALQRIYADQIDPGQQILPPGIPGYRKFTLYHHSVKKARQLIAAAQPSDRKITVWTDNESPNQEAGEYYAGVLREIGFHVHLKVVSAYNYFTVIGNRNTPNLDTGWSNWFEDFPHPDDFFRPMLLGSSVLRTYNGNFAQIDVPSLNAKIEQLSRQPLGPAQERAYAALDRSYMKLAPWAPYGTRVLSTFVSKRVDLGKVIWNPTFGADMATFQLK